MTLEDELDFTIEGLDILVEITNATTEEALATAKNKHQEYVRRFRERHPEQFN